MTSVEDMKTATTVPIDPAYQALAESIERINRLETALSQSMVEIDKLRSAKTPMVSSVAPIRPRMLASYDGKIGTLRDARFQIMLFFELTELNFDQQKKFLSTSRFAGPALTWYRYQVERGVPFGSIEKYF